MPGAIRLRELTAGFLSPRRRRPDPALLDDEAAGLVRDWGLVFLPGGRVLLVRSPCPGRIGRSFWKPSRGPAALGSPAGAPPLAERVDQIMLELPEPAPDVFTVS